MLVENNVRLIRDGIESLFVQTNGFKVINLSPEEEQKIKQECGVPDIVLSLSQLSTITATDHVNRIKNAFPGAKVVILGVSGTENESLEYMEAGASGYVLPDSRLENLIKILQTVHKGEAACPPI